MGVTLSIPDSLHVDFQGLVCLAILASKHPRSALACKPLPHLTCLLWSGLEALEAQNGQESQKAPRAGSSAVPTSYNKASDHNEEFYFEALFLLGSLYSGYEQELGVWESLCTSP